jgi:hypothetical protein
MSVFPAKSRFRRRQGRCYELSFRTMLDIHDAGNVDKVTLVHGIVRFDRLTLCAHAWLESEDGEAYDAVRHVIMPIAQYYKERGAIVERRYTLREAGLVMEETWTYGPWHQTAGTLRD